MGFETMRVKIRKPMTDRARAMIIKELEDLKAQGFDPTAVLAQSEVHSWAGVFPIKVNGQGALGTSKQAQLEARNAEVARRFAEKGVVDEQQR